MQPRALWLSCRRWRRSGGSRRSALQRRTAGSTAPPIALRTSASPPKGCPVNDLRAAPKGWLEREHRPEVGDDAVRCRLGHPKEWGELIHRQVRAPVRRDQQNVLSRDGSGPPVRDSARGTAGAAGAVHRGVGRSGMLRLHAAFRVGDTDDWYLDPGRHVQAVGRGSALRIQFPQPVHAAHRTSSTSTGPSGKVCPTVRACWTTWRATGRLFSTRPERSWGRPSPTSKIFFGTALVNRTALLLVLLVLLVRLVRRGCGACGVGELPDTLYPTRASSMNTVNASTVASGCSSGMKCPASGMTTPVTFSAQGLMEAAMSGIEP